MIHNRTCDDGALGKSAALGDFLGTDGLTKLTSLMSYGIARRRREQPKIHDMDQFTDFFRRMQLPLYEEARDYLRSPEGREEYSDASECLPYLQRSLERAPPSRSALSPELGMLIISTSDVGLPKDPGRPAAPTVTA